MTASSGAGSSIANAAQNTAIQANLVPSIQWQTLDPTTDPATDPATDLATGPTRAPWEQLQLAWRAGDANGVNAAAKSLATAAANIDAAAYPSHD